MLGATRASDFDDGWAATTVAPTLGVDSIQVWRTRLDQPAPILERLSSTLSDEERGRGARFHSPLDRDRYIAARGILREILGRSIGLAADRVRFEYSSNGKVRLGGTAADTEVSFSLSHSGVWALYGLAVRIRVGVDIELLRPIAEARVLARQFFAPSEHAALEALPDTALATAFLTCWTRKEAYLKATGEGLGRGVDQVEVAFPLSARAAFARIGGRVAEAARWTVEALAPADGYVGAAVYEGPALRVIRLEWTAAPQPWDSAGMLR